MGEKKVMIKVKVAGSLPDSAERVTSPEAITEWNLRRIAAALGVLGAALATILYLAFSGGAVDAPAEREVESAALDQEDRNVSAASDPLPDAAEPVSEATPFAKKGPELPGAETSSLAATSETEAPTEAPENERAAKGSEKRFDSTEKAEPSHEPKPPPAASVSTAKGVVRARLSRGILEKEPFGEVVSPVRAKADEAITLYFFTELEGMRGQRVSHQWLREGKLVFEKSLILKANNMRFHTSKLLTRHMLGHWQVQLTDARGKILHSESFELIGPGR